MQIQKITLILLACGLRGGELKKALDFIISKERPSQRGIRENIKLLITKKI